jgi:hypothetical protein
VAARLSRPPLSNTRPAGVRTHEPSTQSQRQRTGEPRALARDELRAWRPQGGLTLACAKRSVATGNSSNVSAAALARRPRGNGPRSVAVGDFNADGDPDLAVANESSANVSVLLGSWRRVRPADHVRGRQHPRSVAVGTSTVMTTPNRRRQQRGQRVGAAEHCAECDRGGTVGPHVPGAATGHHQRCRPASRCSALGTGRCARAALGPSARRAQRVRHHHRHLLRRGDRSGRDLHDRDPLRAPGAGAPRGEPADRQRRARHLGGRHCPQRHRRCAADGPHRPYRSRGRARAPAGRAAPPVGPGPTASCSSPRSLPTATARPAANGCACATSAPSPRRSRSSCAAAVESSSAFAGPPRAGGTASSSACPEREGATRSDASPSPVRSARPTKPGSPSPDPDDPRPHPMLSAAHSMGPPTAARPIVDRFTRRQSRRLA